MTQILNLPQIDGARTSFTITKNAQFQFSIAFPYPAGPQVPIVAACTMVANSAALSGLDPATVASLVTGQPVSGYGIAPGTTIQAIPSTTSVTLSAPATQSGALVGITFQVLPLDISGIAFAMQVRDAGNSLGAGIFGDVNLYLGLSTNNGSLVNGGASGVLAASVPVEALRTIPVTAPGASLATDIIATAADGGPVNLMALNGPASVIVLPGKTRL